MKARIVPAISVFGNVLFAGALLVVLCHSPRESAPTLPGHVQPGEPVLSADSLDTPQAWVPASDQGKFCWVSLQTNNYRVLTARLRGIGCPEATIRDIVIGELNRRYNPKMLALRKASARFWETQQRRIRTTFEEDMTRERAARELEHEKSQIIQDLFGLSFADYLAGGSGRPDLHADLIDHIVPESRPRAREILRKYDQFEHELIERANGTLGKPEMEELREAYYRKRAEMKAFLSNSELEEFELRASPIAEELRNRELVGFSPTEEEFRTIFRIRRDFEQGQENSHPKNDGQLADIDQAQGSLEKRLRDALGEKRYADYQRSQDFAYRRLIEITDHFGLSNEPAIEVHELRLETLREVNRLSENPAVSVQTRQSILQELQAGVRQNVVSALGDEVFAAYLTSPWGNWVEQIGEWTNGVVLRQSR